MKFFFVIKQTFSNLWRERTPVVATILTICIALTILVALFEISFTLYGQLRDLKSNMVVEIYLEPDATDTQINKIRSELESYNTIERLRFVSKETAAEIFHEEFGEDIMDILDENPLPVSFEVLLKRDYNHQEYLSLFKTQAERLPGVDEVHYRHALVEKLEDVTEAVAVGGIFVLLVLVFAMNLLIRNTIKLSVYAKRRQIDIMKVLGAGNLLIRMPYILEGAIEGFLGGMMSAVCLIFAHKFIAGTFQMVSIGAPTYKALWVTTISFGIAIGLLSSAASVGRFVNKIFSKK